MVWIVPPDMPLIWEQFEDAFFLFNPFSNETHVLNELAVEILHILRTGPASLPEILDHLGIEMNHVTDDTTLPYRKLLQELDRFGLILPVVP